MNRDSKIYVAGHEGLVGSGLLRKLQSEGYHNLVTRTHERLDLTDQHAVLRFFGEEQPEIVFLAAAKTGGILANNTLPAEFIGINLMIQTNVIDAAYRTDVEKLVFLGSSCIYPKHAPQPMTEEHLLTGSLEPTNEFYAVAKIAGLKMVQAYRRQYGFNGISLMPTNLYGPGDDFDLETSHVLAALIRKIHQAKTSDATEIVVWGSGKPRREFLHVDDLADAALHVMLNYEGEEILNIGVGKDISIHELAGLVSEIVGYCGTVVYDSSKPDGTPRKLLDISRLRDLGWRPKIGLREGIESTYRWYVENIADSVRTPASRRRQHGVVRHG